MPVDEIHVWQVALPEVVMLSGEFWQALNGAERQKAVRLRNDKNQNRAIVSRGLLRFFLGWYLRVDPAAIEFSYGATAKPSLTTGPGLEFNVAHCDDLLLYAFTCQHSVGIDVEHVRELPELLAIASRFFSRREQDLLAVLPAADQTTTFYTLWTLREAYVKMQGSGLSDDIQNLDLLYLLKTRTDWAFETFAPVPGHAAALVVDGCVRRPIRFKAFRGAAS
jgi:4'-phosphopantetheinyl transferase